VLNIGQVSGRWPVLVTLQRLRRMMTALSATGRGFDVLHAFWIAECGVLATLAGRLWRVPVVVSVGGGELVWIPEVAYGGQGHWHKRLQTSLALRLADVITAGSQYAWRPLDTHKPQPQVVPLGVDTARFQAPVQRPDGPPWRLLHVASLNPVKNQAMCLQAVRLVRARLPGVQLDIVGEDWLDGALQRQVNDLGLANIVRFHGFLENDAITPLLRQAHLYLQSSWHESQGVAVCEAAVAGVPTIGTAVGLVADLAPMASWAVPCNDAPAMADAIITLLNNPHCRQKLGQAAQRWAYVHDADWTAATFEAIYQQLRVS
jgi:glycosyltransferase involved in cell wall biosynthesis